MLVRMLTERNPDVKLLDHPCGAARGPQMEWLQAEDYAEGMRAETRQEFDEKISTGIGKWREELEKAKQDVVLAYHQSWFSLS